MSDPHFRCVDLSGVLRRPTQDHVGLPVVLPGGEEGRLLRFAHDEDPVRWTYALEFRGSRE